MVNMNSLVRATDTSLETCEDILLNKCLRFSKQITQILLFKVHTYAENN